MWIPTQVRIKKTKRKNEAFGDTEVRTRYQMTKKLVPIFFRYDDCVEVVF